MLGALSRCRNHGDYGRGLKACQLVFLVHQSHESCDQNWPFKIFLLRSLAAAERFQESSTVYVIIMQLIRSRFVLMTKLS
ncbi:hypothetical protein NC652_018595 [Populus alba x Populus x berolinensis]|nr:hypothetical protein NC652_018595 [Populus alba x Populus x berolinensis]